MSDTTRPLEDDLPNAALALGLLAVLVASAVGSALRGALLWAGFSASVVAIAIAPAVAARSPTVQPAWEILLLSALPAIARLFDVGGEAIGYVSTAALALLVVAEIDAFTAAELTPRFSGVLVVLTTLSVASTWAIAQFASDAYLGTAFLADRYDLMWELVTAALVGVGAGVLFSAYCTELELLRRVTGRS